MTDGRNRVVVDSRGVDRVVTAPGCPAIKAQERTRPGDRLAFAIPEAEVGDHDGWYALLLHAYAP